MLVEHDVQAQLVGKLPLVVIAVEEFGRPHGIELAVRQIHAQRAIMVVPHVGIGLLRELEDSHGAGSSTNSTMRRASASGCSRCGKCPAPLSSANRAPGIAASKLRPYS